MLKLYINAWLTGISFKPPLCTTGFWCQVVISDTSVISYSEEYKIRISNTHTIKVKSKWGIKYGNNDYKL